VVGVPKEVMDGFVGYPSDQCLIEVLDYWLRHHLGQLKWEEVAHALKEAKLHQLAKKALQISTTGQFLLY
jgi:ribonuclease HII